VGIRVAQEVFADRAYNEDGTLVPRSMPGAVIDDPLQATERALEMVLEGKVKAINGKDYFCINLIYVAIWLKQRSYFQALFSLVKYRWH